MLLSCVTLATVSASIFSLLAVSFDRYLSICHALLHRKHVSKKFTLCTVLVCWILGIFEGFLPLGCKSGLFAGKCDGRILLSYEYIYFLSLTGAFLPTSALIIIYVKIYKKVLELVRTKVLRSFRKNLNSSIYSVEKIITFEYHCPQFVISARSESGENFTHGCGELRNLLSTNHDGLLLFCTAR